MVDEDWLKIGDQEYYPKPGELFLIPEGMRQSYSCISDQPFQKYWCQFSAKVGDINLFKILELSHGYGEVDREVVKELFSSLTMHAKSDAVYAHLLAKSKLMELFCYFIMNIDQNFSIRKLAEIPCTQNRKSQRAALQHTKFRQSNCDQLGFNDLFYFSKQFKKNVSITPTEFRKQRV